MKYLFVVAVFLLSFASITYSPAAQAQASCSGTYDSTKKYCIPVVVEPWKWYWTLGGGAEHGPFDSEGATLSDLQSFTLGPTGSGQSWCSMSLDHMNYDSTPQTFVGMPTSYDHGAHFNVTEYKSDVIPCQRHVMAGATIRQTRSVGCPPTQMDGDDWALISGGATGPRCEISWTEVFDRDCKHCKGNPVDVMNNSKIQVELDYAGAGPFPLRFARTYESRIAYKTYQGSSDQELFTPLGIGWTASYFQSIRDLPEGLRKGAAVFRPNGRRIYFNETAGQMSAQAGVTERLTRLVNGSGNLTGWQLITPEDETESYDASGRLVSIQNRNGLTQTISYNGNSHSPQSVSDAFGHTLTFAYDTAKVPRVQTVTLPDGNQITFIYNSSENLLTATYPGSLVRQYHYELTSGRKNLLTGLTDEAGVRFATWTYASTVNGAGVTSSKHAGNVDLYTFSSPTAGTRTVVDPLGQTRTYGSSVRKGQRLPGSSTAVTPGSNEPKTATYDVNGNLAVRKDFNNNETRFTYDMARNLETSRTEAYGTAKARTITTLWNPTFNLPAQIEDSLKRVTFSYGSSGELLSRTVLDLATSQTRTWSYTYNSFAQVLTENGPRTDISDVTTYTYYTCSTGYQCGQLYTITNTLGHTTTYNFYNANGQPTQITDANGLVTSLAYDPLRRLADRCVGATLPTCSGGEPTHLDYWPTNLLQKVTNPDGSFIEYTYDPAHRLTQINDGALNKIVYTLDNAGNRTGENTYDPGNALRRTHTRVFNTLSQLWKDVNAAGTANVTTTFAYDANSNPTSTSAPLSRNSASLYDELNRLKQITDPASGVTLFGYDANDNLISVTDPRSLVTSYTYTGFGDLKTQTSPDTGLTTNTYDSGGNLDTSTDSRGAVTDYGYDAVNRLTSASFTLSGVTDQIINYAYDTGTNQNGRLTSASDADHTLAWTYDAQGRVTGKGQTVGGVTLAMGYGYNAAGQLGNIVLPSGASIAFGYNANGQVTSLTLNGSTTILSAITYDPFGPINGWTWGNATTASRAFDTDGKIFQVDNAGGANLKNYAYDDAFRITGISDAMDPTLSWTFGYDLLDRLNSASKTGTTQGWTYDANGNRLTETGSTPNTYTNAGTSNRVSAISGSLPRTYAYDSAGNTLSYAGATFTYNNRGRMDTATNAGVTASYVYNALGQRVSRTASGVTTLYAYDEAGHLAGEYTAAGVLIQETVWLGDTPVATLRPNGSGGVIVFYVHADHLNTPRLVTDTSNNIRWRWDSDPFGTTMPNENPAALGVFAYNLRFPGQQFDSVVGLNYNYFRDYDPSVGRYVESDPLGILTDKSLYSYVRGNPLRFIDPRGLIAWAPYVECLQAQADGDYMRSCGDVLFASAVAAEIEPIQNGCKLIEKGLKCTTRCTGEELFGSFASFAEIVYAESALKLLEHIAHTAASEWLKRGVPVLNAIHVAHKVYLIGRCTTNCVRT